MRRTLVGLIAALALGGASSMAMAADMAVPEPAPVMSWTGFYLGAGGGVAWADLDLNHRVCSVDHDGVCFEDWDFHRDFNESSDGGIIGIVQGGFDWEVAPSFVVGVGADWTFGDVLGGGVDRNQKDDEIFGFDHHFSNDGSSLVDVYGRAGFAPTQSLLIFGLVGWTWADIDTEFRLRDGDETVFHNSDNFSANGISFGGGVEWKFTDNLSIRGEYRFTDLDNFDNNGHFEWGNYDHRVKNDIDLDVQRVLFTLNWRFGGFGAATAAAY